MIQLPLTNRPQPRPGIRWQDPFPGVPRDTYDRWRAYHGANRRLWAPFENEIFAQIDQGLKRLPAKSAAEDVRKKHGKANERGDFYIDNRWVAYYGRAFARMYPQYADRFEFRETQGVKEAA